MSYPRWQYFPTSRRPPDWVRRVVQVFADAREQIDSGALRGQTSDGVLSALRPGLERLGFTVEAGKRADDKVRRPVLFGPNGAERVAYEIDAFHDDLGIVVEVEAGRGARGNAVYRDLIRTSLIVDAQYLVIGVLESYRHQSAKREMVVRSYADALNQLDAIYASGRLQFPFKGILLVGY